jgi:hypothetical protein
VFRLLDRKYGIHSASLLDAVLGEFRCDLFTDRMLSRPCIRTLSPFPGPCSDQIDDDEMHSKIFCRIAVLSSFIELLFRNISCHAPSQHSRRHIMLRMLLLRNSQAPILPRRPPVEQRLETRNRDRHNSSGHFQHTQNIYAQVGQNACDS